MAECSTCNVPLMASFHNSSGSNSGFQFLEVSKKDTMFDILSKQGPEDWSPFEDVMIKSSSSRSGNFDKFSMNNTVELISRILKTDVVWVIFEKQNVFSCKG